VRPRAASWDSRAMAAGRLTLRAHINDADVGSSRCWRVCSRQTGAPLDQYRAARVFEPRRAVRPFAALLESVRDERHPASPSVVYLVVGVRDNSVSTRNVNREFHT
jgi:hypothetical protein